MKVEAMLECEAQVRDGLGVPAGESIAEWCERRVWRWKGRKRKAAFVLLRKTVDPWADMFDAARILRGLGP